MTGHVLEDLAHPVAVAFRVPLAQHLRELRRRRPASGRTRTRLRTDFGGRALHRFGDSACCSRTGRPPSAARTSPGTNRCTRRAPSRRPAATRARRRCRNRTRRRRRNGRRSPARRSARPCGMRTRASRAARARRARRTRYWSGGRLRRNVSRSSGELTVIVQTVFGSARASCGQTPASKAASRAMRSATRAWTSGSARKKTRQYYTFAAESAKTAETAGVCCRRGVRTAVQAPDQDVDQVPPIGRLAADARAAPGRARASRSAGSPRGSGCRRSRAARSTDLATG